MSETLTKRDAFIIEKAPHFSPTEIQVLLEREGFKPVTVGRIYQILELRGVKPKRNRSLGMIEKGDTLKRRGK